MSHDIIEKSKTYSRKFKEHRNDLATVFSILIAILSIAITAWVGFRKSDSDYFSNYIFASLVVLLAFFGFQVLHSIQIFMLSRDNARLSEKNATLKTQYGENQKYGALTAKLVVASSAYSTDVVAKVQRFRQSKNVSDSAKSNAIESVDDVFKRYIRELSEHARYIVAARHSVDSDIVESKIRLFGNSGRSTIYTTVARSINCKPSKEGQIFNPLNRAIEGHYIYSKLALPDAPDRAFCSWNHMVDKAIGDERFKYLRPTMTAEDYCVLVVPIYGPKVAFGARISNIDHQRYGQSDVLIGFVHVYSSKVSFDLDHDAVILKGIANSLYSAIAEREMATEIFAGT